jgi:hypothetical protein
MQLVLVVMDLCLTLQKTASCWDFNDESHWPWSKHWSLRYRETTITREICRSLRLPGEETGCEWKGGGRKLSSFLGFGDLGASNDLSWTPLFYFILNPSYLERKMLCIVQLINLIFFVFFNNMMINSIKISCNAVFHYFQSKVSF